MKQAMVVTGLAFAALAAVACKKKEAQPGPQMGMGPQCGGYNQPPCQPGPATTCGGYGQPACGTAPPPTAPPPAACGGVGQPPCAAGTTPAPTDPIAGLISGFLAGAQAAVGTVAGGDAGPIKGGIELRARDVAKGMKPDGQLFTAQLTQGGHAQGAITLQPGKCYTVVGFGGFGVMRYQINLVMEIPAPTILAQSGDADSAPVLGANEGCYRTPSPVPVPAKIDMFLVQGQGTVGAQLYSK